MHGLWAEFTNVWWKVPQKAIQQIAINRSERYLFPASSSLDSLFMVRSYGVGPHRRAAMDNHINETEH